MTTHAGGFDHVALLYDDVDQIGPSLAPGVREALARDDAVLVCLEPPKWEALAGSLGADADRVTYLPADARYAHPARALAALWSFASRARLCGDRTVQSIGEIAFDGAVPDADWWRYETAVNEVLREVPVVATCLFDARSTSAAALDALARTHTVATRAGADATSGTLDDSLFVEPELSPGGTPGLVLDDVTSPRVARAAVVAFARRFCADERRIADVELVVSELVTNALTHGGPPVGLRGWGADDGLALEVHDDGPGITDRYAAWRPPALPRRGAGLWTAHLLADRLSLGPARGGHDGRGGTTVTVVFGRTPTG